MKNLALLASMEIQFQTREFYMQFINNAAAHFVASPVPLGIISNRFFCDQNARPLQ